MEEKKIVKSGIVICMIIFALVLHIFTYKSGYLYNNIIDFLILCGSALIVYQRRVGINKKYIISVVVMFVAALILSCLKIEIVKLPLFTEIIICIVVLCIIKRKSISKFHRAFMEGYNSARNNK